MRLQVARYISSYMTKGNEGSAEYADLFGTMLKDAPDDTSVKKLVRQLMIRTCGKDFPRQQVSTHTRGTWAEERGGAGVSPARHFLPGRHPPPLSAFHVRHTSCHSPLSFVSLCGRCSTCSPETVADTAR